MRTQIFAIFSILFLAFQFQLEAAAQNIDPIHIQNLEVNAKIDEATKNEIINSVQNRMEEYESAATFWNENIETFDDQKFADFMTLFSDNAKVYNDIYLSSEPLSHPHYAAIAFELLHDKGVPFKIDEWEIVRIDIDETGFFIAEIEVSKKMYVGINSLGRVHKIPNGRTVPLVIKMDMPNYLISNAQITEICPPSKKGLLEAIGELFDRKNKDK